MTDPCGPRDKTTDAKEDQVAVMALNQKAVLEQAMAEEERKGELEELILARRDREIGELKLKKEELEIAVQEMRRSRGSTSAACVVS